MVTGYFWLNDRQWEKIDPLLPVYIRGKRRVDDRRVISGIIQVIISGCRWSDAPLEYGPRKTLYNRFVRWAVRGIWERVFMELARAGGPPAEALLDSTISRSTGRPAPGGEKGGFARDRNEPRRANTKIHQIADAHRRTKVIG